MSKFLPITALMILLAVSTGCVAAIGNKGTERSREGTTLGQELIDLKKAMEAGLLTEQQYQRERNRLLAP